MNTTINIYLKREQLYIVLLFLFSGGKMTKELQSSRYIVISFLVREMGIDIVEAISLMAELEKSGLVRLELSGDLILKELGGELRNELPQINTKLQNGITNYLKFFLRMRNIWI